MRLTWPLTGRSEELRIIHAAISDPASSGIVICGAAGVGKSRIAREALSFAESKGCQTRWAVGTSSARVLPLGAFAPWAREVAADNLQLVRGVIDALTAPQGGARVIVGVDDVHLLDDLSTFALHQIIRRGAAKAVLTVRDGEPVSPATQELWRAGQLGRLDLQPLSSDETTALVSAALGGSVDLDAASRLWMLTRGNVLYVRNIVEQEVCDGRLAQHHGYWRWTGDPIVSPSLVELIEARMGALPTSVSDVVDALAVGEPLELAALTRVTGSEAVEEADLRGLITVEAVDRQVEVRLAHPLYGEVRRKRVAPTRLRRLRGLVATELARGNDCNDIRTVVRRAELILASDLELDPDLFTRAAQGAALLADLQLVDRLADAAIRAGAGPEANFIRALALTWLGRGEEADAAFAAIEPNALNDEGRAVLTYLRADNMLWAVQDPPGAKKLIDEALESTPPGNRACINAFLTVHSATQGKPHEAMKTWEKLDVDELPAIVRSQVAWALAYSPGVSGRVTEAAALAESGYSVTSQTLHTAHARLAIGDAHVSTLVLSGQIEAANNTAQALRKQAADLHAGVELISRGVEALAALGAGRLDAVCSLAQPVVEALSAAGISGGYYPFGYRFQIPHTIALAMCGATDDAVAALATLGQGLPTWQMVDWQRCLAQSWVLAAQGALSKAITSVRSAADTARANGQFAVEVMCLQTATQFGDRTTGPRLHELEAIVEGPRVGVAARFADALRADNAAELAAVSEEFERMGDLIAAVDAAAHAAVVYRREDRRGSALGCSTRADALAERCGGASTPALRRASERVPLTDREREIVMLLGQGLASRDIATLLTLSVRTVESHIYRAMAKTGTSSRGELAALMHKHPSKPVE